MKRVIVAGGGPAGLMAAYTAAVNGARVVLLEKKNRVGKKLSITGNGRCNLTSAVESRELVKGFPGNGRFLYSAFHEFSNFDLIEFFNRHGLPTKVESGSRVFPVSDRAQDVVDILSGAVHKAGVEILLSSRVISISLNDAKAEGIKTEEGCMKAQAVVVATGGLSYPGTGSTGDGYIWASQAGHRIIEPRPGLVPLTVKEKWIKELQGLSLRNVKVRAYTEQGKLINEDTGEMLFAHFGLSGPVILSMSHHIAEYLAAERQAAVVKIDLKPDLSEDTLDELIRGDFARYSRRMFKNALNDLLPPKIIPVIISLSAIEPEKECHQITRAERLEFVKLLKNFTLTVNGTRPIEEAIVTAGGVDVKEVNPRTMESKLVKGLYFAGEVLDVNGYTGGYNLQAAFSTGYLAGKCAALD